LFFELVFLPFLKKYRLLDSKIYFHLDLMIVQAFPRFPTPGLHFLNRSESIFNFENKEPGIQIQNLSPGRND